MPRLTVVTVSTRPGRIGPSIAQWFYDQAVKHEGFDVEVVDLAELDLPLLDEPHHPRLGTYTKEHTHRWASIVRGSDAFVFVTPEYNFAMPASLKNALDYLSAEWHYKPVAFVSYGGVSAGLRGVQMAKEVVTTLKMFPIPEAVALPMVTSMFTEDGEFTPPAVSAQAATAVLDELAKVESALSVLRTPADS